MFSSGVNWSALGTCSPEDAIAYANLIVVAAGQLLARTGGTK